MTRFAELIAATNYSFLRGASHPCDMVAEAIRLGMAGVGIADHNTVAGVVRAWSALRDAREQAKEELGEDIDFKLIVGARLVFADGTPDIVAYPATRKGWGRLTRLLTLGNLRAVKGGCILRFDDLIEYLEDLMLIVLPASTGAEVKAHRDPVDYVFEKGRAAHETTHLKLVEAAPRDLTDVLSRLASKAPGRIWLGTALHHRGNDACCLVRMQRLALQAGVPLIATNDALYAEVSQRPLHDVLTCVREGTTIAEAGRRLEANAERRLKSPTEMARLFSACLQAIGETIRFLARIDFALDDLRYEYPHEPVPESWEPQAWLEHLVMESAYKRYGTNLPEKVKGLIAEEFALIRKQAYACYFLTVHDLVKFARAQEPPILCQGRGSAANSIVCFLLGVTSVDPVQHNLLFSRFVSEERSEPPDIDVDFEHERREEVMQYVYRRYGRHRAGIAGTVIHYRPRSAVREIGKVLGFSEDVTARISSTIWGSYASSMEARRFAETGFALDNPAILRLKSLIEQVLNFPRHLSQHVGGFVLTEDRLDETVPLHNAAMADRTFIEWDKDDIDALGLMKVDILALGMLTCIRKSFDLMRENAIGDQTLEVDIKADDPAVYDMLCRGDSIGVFQVESRAQMNMLPRLKPRCLYDLTVQIAIVRPGPIQGDMVHPYLRRRADIEKVEFPSPKPPHDPDELRSLLGQTYGVPLFQEQVMKLAITAAGFTPSQANQLRRAMATFRNVGTIQNLQDKMIEGMTGRGYERDFAERCFKQIEGFGSYGFPESHALSFARLVYVSSWIKCHHPAVFACALLNAQPMGFYAPAQIVRDAREHDVEVRAIDVNASKWNNGLERREDGALALRLGCRQIDGFREDWAQAVVAARVKAVFTGIEDIARRASLPQRALRLLADADAFRSIDLDRRNALWEVRRTPNGELPLFAVARAQELGEEPDIALPSMSRAEHVVADYQMTRLSLKDHPMSFLRDELRAEGIASCAETSVAKNGVRIRAAGIVLVRQRPGKGNAIFVTIEDETGVANIVLWARLFELYRRQVMAARLMLIDGTVQRSPEGVTHLMATRIHDRTTLLDHLSDRGETPTTLSPGDEFRHPQHPPTSGHPRNTRILPKSRDFH